MEDPRPMLKVISGLFVLGAVYGTIGFLTALTGGAFAVTHGPLLAALSAGLFGLTLAVALWSLRGTPRAITALQVVALPQVLWLERMPVTFHFMAGPYLFLDVKGTTTAPLLGIGGTFEALTQPPGRGVAINLAVALALFLLAALKRASAYREASSAASR